MSNINVKLRPAWRNYWLGLAIVGFLLFGVLGGVVGEWANDDLYIRFMLVAPIVLGILGFVVYKRYLWRFTIDGNRVSRHYGIISRNQQSVRIKDLRSVELNQSLFQRLFGIGDLSFYSAGSASAEVVFHGIKDPVGWRDKIDSTLDNLKDSNE